MLYGAELLFVPKCMQRNMLSFSKCRISGDVIVGA
jgi:hypothetical protein